MKRIGILFSFLIVTSTFSQDIHFTQLQQTPMLQNPAFTGMFSGWERVGIAHKSQWVSAGTKFQTTSVAADMNFFKSKGENSAHLGVGLQFYNDKGGDSKFGTKQMLMNANAIVPLGESHALSAAIQVGIGQRTGDLRQLLFANQFNGNELDQTLPNNENNTLVSFVYPDIGFGLNYRYGNHKIGFARDDATDFTLGFSYLHVNKPELKYRLGFKEELYARLGINASFLKDISGSKIGVEVIFNQYLQGPHAETIFGGLFRYRLSTGSKTTGLTRDSHLSGGIFYRVNDAISPVVFVDIKGFKLGLSYDITLSKLGQVARAGGLEFSLVYTNLDFALFKRRRN